MGDIRRVLVVGGGIGGLTAATAFAQRGVEVVVIERRPNFDVPGVGLGQPANALRVYDSLGVLSEILQIGFTYDRMRIFDASREKLIAEHKFLLGDSAVPATCALSRLQLHEILLSAAKRAGAQVRTGLTVSEIHDEKDSVTVTYSDGRTESFDLLAGFDGIRSTSGFISSEPRSRRVLPVMAAGACRCRDSNTSGAWSSSLASEAKRAPCRLAKI